MGKWLWRYPIEHHTLWVAVIWSKFGRDSNCWDAVHLPSTSHQSPWKCISRFLLLFHPSTKLSLGCGSKIRFWIDPWAGLLPFSSSFPCLFHLSSLQGSTISSFISPDSSWDLHFRLNPSDSELDELSSLLNLPFEFPHLDPFLFWPFFYVLFLLRPLFTSSGPFPYKSNWFHPIPSKGQAFLWKLAWYQVPTFDLVQSFNSHLTLFPNVCSLCLSAVEIADICSFVVNSLGDYGANFFNGGLLLPRKGVRPHLLLEIVLVG